VVIVKVRHGPVIDARFAGVEVPAQRVGALAVDVREHGLTVFSQPLADIATVGSANTAEAGFRGGVALEKFGWPMHCTIAV
jgi:hypothetical protein